MSSDPDPPVLYEGEKLALRCLVRKGTHLSFTWYRDKQEVNASSDLYRLSEDALTVDEASELHAGMYSCTAHNQMEVDPRFSSSGTLHVIVKSSSNLTAIKSCATFVSVQYLVKNASYFRTGFMIFRSHLDTQVVIHSLL